MGSPHSALAAAGWHRLPVSSWPWRSAAYLLTGLPPAAVAFGVLGVPWLVLAARAGEQRIGGAVMLVLFGAALTVTVGPLVAAPLATLERRRLRLVDNREIEVGHPVLAGPVSWLRARYLTPTAWREVGYSCLLASVAPVLSLAALLTVPLGVAFVASPLLVRAQRPGGEPVALVFGQVTTLDQTMPYVIGGALLLLAAPYLLTLVAGGHAAVARSLLVGGAADRLYAELVEVSRSRARLADAFEAERRRIQRDLHDGAQQTLVSLTMRLGMARLDLPPVSPAAEQVNAAYEQAKELMAELRALIHGIQPEILTELGLPAALEELADRAPLPVTVDARLTDRLPGRVESIAYFAAAEALTNVAKHSAATHAHISAHRTGDVLVLEISDDGRGGADPGRGSGLTGLADRAAVIGGRMLLSSPPGGPTLIRVELPCHQAPSE